MQFRFYKVRKNLDCEQIINYFLGVNPVVAHLDLKSPNILLTKSTSNSNSTSNSVNSLFSCPYTAKLIDFGTAELLKNGEKIKVRKVDNPVWLAPEILEGKPYDHKVRYIQWQNFSEKFLHIFLNFRWTRTALV